MAQSDEDKVNAALANEVEAETPAEPETPAADPQPVDEPKSEDSQDKPDESEGTFTKPQGYEWVKGDTLEEFNANLLIAYENSTAEALRLRQTPAPAEVPPAPASAPSALTPEQAQALQYAQAVQQGDMVKAFDDFAKNYPQSREPQSFDQFQKASAGATQAFMAAFNRMPTYPELFEKTASLLGWQPSDQKALKDAALKDALTSGNTQTAGSTPPKKLSIDSPDALKTLEILRRIPGNAEKSDADLVKDLQT